jgi:hypothetical protein
MNFAPDTAFVPANDYHEAIADDNTWFNPDVDGSSGAPSLNWTLANSHWQLT